MTYNIIFYEDADIDYKGLIQVIYQNCPNLKLLLDNYNSINPFVLKEFESLLVNCQFLDGLIIIIYDRYDVFSWDRLHQLAYLKYFFVNWQDRKPILLEVSDNILRMNEMDQRYQILAEQKE